VGAFVKLRNAFLVTLLISLVSVAHAAGNQADVYFGYSRVGTNLYAVNTPGMNGWQLAMHIKPIPFVGIEGEVSRYGQSTNDGFTQKLTLAMFGPRVTVHAAGFSFFAHGLGGIAHENAQLATYPGGGYNATSYAFGGGADVPLFLGFKLRVMGDYLGNSDAPSSSSISVGSVSHFRIGTGIAYHFGVPGKRRL
jgi:hypothetical protein